MRDKGARSLFAVDRASDSASTAESTTDSEDDKETITLFKVGAKTQRPIVITISVNGQLVPMEVNMGAAVSVISSTMKTKVFPECPLKRTSAILTTYTRDQLPVLGRMKVQARYGEQRAQLSLYVVEGHGPSLMGGDWLTQIRLEWKSIRLASLTSGQRSLTGTVQ